MGKEKLTKHKNIQEQADNWTIYKIRKINCCIIMYRKG